MERTVFLTVRAVLEMVKRDGKWPDDVELCSVSLRETPDGPVLALKIRSKTMDTEELAAFARERRN